MSDDANDVTTDETAPETTDAVAKETPADEAPAADEPTAEAVEEPVAEAVDEAPAAEAPAEEPAVDEPVAEEVVADTVAEDVTEEPVAEEPATVAESFGPVRVARVYVCERGHRTTTLWGEPDLCHAQPTRSGPKCGMKLYHITELPEQVQKALNPLKASKKASKK